jgi:hypothetical protein
MTSFAGYELAEGMSDQERTIRVLLAVRRQGRARAAAERERAEAALAASSALERARARVEGHRG